MKTFILKATIFARKLLSRRYMRYLLRISFIFDKLLLPNENLHTKRNFFELVNLFSVDTRNLVSQPNCVIKARPVFDHQTPESGTLTRCGTVLAVWRNTQS